MYMYMYVYTYYLYDDMTYYNNSDAGDNHIIKKRNVSTLLLL